MARAKRANRGDTERSRWSNGTADAGHRDEPGWGAQVMVGGSQARPNGPGTPGNGFFGDPGSGPNGGPGETAAQPTAAQPTAAQPTAEHRTAAGQNKKTDETAGAKTGQAAAARTGETAAVSTVETAGVKPPENTGERPPETPGWQQIALANGRPVTVAPRQAGFGTPVRVDEIALAAKALSEDLLAATQGMPETVASRQLRRDLDNAVETFRAVASELQSTAGSLVRLAASEGQVCGVTWGVCPDHGLTLMNVGEVATCHVLGCHHEQQGPTDRCAQPVAYKVVDVAGPALFTCAGHAIACRLHLDGAVITLATDSLELL
ncbi:hypothetical protein [Kribbella italica]|uniref:Uncharacterized protein n=1 Tax=Kribbella italica TaxID=1540520 RepID=A0A7W9MUB1_9ACTN|nr:hypothetical protein [Kribbella italica]MBB5836010.1 hypothetical protein [Kribbella italica]